MGRSNTHVEGTIYRHRSQLPLLNRRSTSPMSLHGKDPSGPGRGGGLALIGVAEQKMHGATPGTFSLTLKRGTVDLTSEIRAGDWVVYWWVENGVRTEGSIGRIEGLRRSTTSKDGATVETWTIAGKDYQSVIGKTPFWFDEFMNLTGLGTGGGHFMTKRMKATPGGRPDHVVLRLLDAFLGQEGVQGGLWLWPEGMSWLGDIFVDGLGVRRITTDGRRQRHWPTGRLSQVLAEIQLDPSQGLRGELFEEISLFQPQQGVMLSNMVDEWSNPELNEVIFDLRPNAGEIFKLGTPDQPVPMVTIRERPFVSPAYGQDSLWFRLPTHDVRPEDIATADVGYSDDERLNLFFLYSSNNGLSQRDQYALFTPKGDIADIGRHGLRKFERGTRFSGAGGRGAGAFTAVAREWRELLTAWYAINPYLLNGSITLKQPRAKIRIGERLRISAGNRRLETYYVEGTSRTWQYPQLGSSTFQVTRGWVGEDADLLRLTEEAVDAFETTHPSVPE